MPADEDVPTCGVMSYWWDGEYEGYCELPQGHVPDDAHFDGLTWFDDNNEQVSDPRE